MAQQDIYSEAKVRAIVREETSDIRAFVKQLQVEQHRQVVLLEGVESHLRAVLDLLSTSLKTKRRADDHAERLESVETTQRHVLTTLGLHSRQLRAKS